ncbi:MAG: calcium/sodium antiporter [bacterium]
MILDIVFLSVGLALLFGGGDALVRGAAALARHLGISALVVGLTVVAFGTSAPELAVNILAALQNKDQIAFGNIVGSNIANIALILGLSALIRPLTVDFVLIAREIPMMFLASVAALAMSLDRFLDKSPDTISRSDGSLLLLFFCIFLYYTVNDARKQRAAEHSLIELEQIPAVKEGRPLVWAGALTVLGLACVVLGGHLTVKGAVALAERLGVSQTIIGLTIVAVGTSLPELATSLMAARRGQSDIAIGNIIGSNIFNLLFILGISVTISPISVPPGGHIDLIVMTGLSVFLLPLAISDEGRIVRVEGAVLLGAYFVYTTCRVLL